ncbi:MAG: hypothetical protein JWP89_4407 [Schlesneria sp.]|nr:hypothetical protein [Schlesneria sp.]
MIQPTQLLIRLTPGTLRSPLGVPRINELRGGPDTLLRWLETQLGLPVPDIHRSSCVTEYAAALDSIVDSTISDSMKTDRWATASELLSRRDELLISGWDQSDSDSLPEVVRDLARAAKERVYVFPSIADRLQRVLLALNTGQQLPAHQCVLLDPIEVWPLRWQDVLARLSTAPAGQASPASRKETSLNIAQRVVLGGDIHEITQDESFRYVHTLSQSAAIEFIAATLANDASELPRTVIVCENDFLALQLDACLSRVGLPTMGATAYSKAHPALQVLPLTLALCWEPVNPQALLDFLTLPISPIPRRAASKLANALAKQPGLGSDSWETALQELCSADSDNDGKLRERLNSWLFCERTGLGGAIASRLIRSRCGTVAQWASGRAVAMAKEAQPNLPLIQALQVAAGQASLLGELAETQGAHLTEPQLGRLLEEALGSGVETKGFIEADGGPTRVRSLAEIDHPCHRLIWLGVGTADATPSRWSADQLAMLQSAGVDIDDGSKTLTSLRSAEANGICQVEDSLLAVLLPQDIEKRWHPIWLAIRGLLSNRDHENPLVLESLISQGNVTALSPFILPIQVTEIQPPQGHRPLWEVPKELLCDRDSASATELEDRLACPLKWVLNYQAQLRSSPIARLPADFQLKGSFCHSVLERVFDCGSDLPPVNTAIERVLEVFDHRIALDAAPLAQPDRYLERQKLRTELEHATRVLIGTLASGGYRIKGIEVDVSGEAFGKPLAGSIDCLAERDGCEEVIIDFKYGGRSKYYSKIEDGKAVQLATYAYGRFTSSGRFPAIAYLILSDGLLYTPSGSPIAGDGDRSVIDGPAIQDVWNSFAHAIENADDWLTGDAPIPARPLLSPENWPTGANMVLETSLKTNDIQPVCKYCQYKNICGLQETT